MLVKFEIFLQVFGEKTEYLKPPPDNTYMELWQAKKKRYMDDKDTNWLK